MRTRALPLLSLGAFALLLGGCQSADRVNRPLPEGFVAKRPDGTRLERQDLVGRPWVINVWLPG